MLHELFLQVLHDVLQDVLHDFLQLPQPLAANSEAPEETISNRAITRDIPFFMIVSFIK